MAYTLQSSSMQALMPSPGADSTLALGLHDLLEQSISRSRLGAGVSNHTATASPRSSVTTKLRSSLGTPRSQSRNARSHERSEVQAASQAGSPTTSTASLEGEGSGRLSRTALPERRQLEYSSPGSNTDNTVNLSRADKSFTQQQVRLHTKLPLHVTASLTQCHFAYTLRHLQNRRQFELRVCLPP